MFSVSQLLVLFLDWSHKSSENNVLSIWISLIYWYAVNLDNKKALKYNIKFEFIREFIDEFIYDLFTKIATTH